MLAAILTSFSEIRIQGKMPEVPHRSAILTSFSEIREAGRPHQQAHELPY